jgi:hypothetical protein
VHWQIAVLPSYSPPLNLLDYNIWGIFKIKGNAMAHRKIGSPKQTIWQLHAESEAMLQQNCRQAGRVLRRLSLLAAALPMISQATVLTYNL